MTTRTVSAEYIMGITEARKDWRHLTPEERVEMAPDFLRNIEETMRTFSPGPVKDYLKGERDFWKHQIKRRKDGLAMLEITKDVAVKVLETVDAGLVSGVGHPVPGQMCVEAAVCYALGLPHGDDPGCVAPALRRLKIGLNDSNWSSSQARAEGLRRLAVAQLGSKDVLDEKEFTRRVAELVISTSVARALESAAALHPQDEHKQALLNAAKRCREEKSQAAARAARAASAAARAASAAADAAAYAASAAADAAARAADAAASAAARAASAAADAAARAADAAAYAAYAAARAAARAASAAARAARDKELAAFAEGVVQVLIAMDAPGCQWLPLTARESAAS